METKLKIVIQLKYDLNIELENVFVMVPCLDLKLLIEKY